MIRDVEKAYDILKDVATTSTNSAHTKYYSEFISLGDEIAKKLVSNIYIIDGSSNIVDVKDDILKIIRYGSLPKYEQKIFERLGRMVG